MMMAGNCERFSFKTHAQAPARRAAACNLGSSYCETRTTRVPGNRAVISTVAHRPSIGFIRQSINTQSGRSAAHTAIASSPSPASQMWLARLSTTCLTIRRIRRSSSTIRILCTAGRGSSHRAASSGNPCEHGRRRTCEHGERGGADWDLARDGASPSSGKRRSPIAQHGHGMLNKTSPWTDEAGIKTRRARKARASSVQGEVLLEL